MELFSKLVRGVVPLAVLLLAACSGGVQSGTVAAEIRVTTLAGSGDTGWADGTGSAASFALPVDVTVDQSGNVYVADSLAATIRKITPAGVVTTLAGTLFTNGSADGMGTAATFNGPQAITVDQSGNLYVGDSPLGTAPAAIRKITPAGMVSTLVASSKLGDPKGIVLDAFGNLYVTDGHHCSVNKVTQAGVVTTLAGGGCGVSSVGSAKDGTGLAASFTYHIGGITIDKSGNLYVADWDSMTIRKITPFGVVTTLAGSGTWGSADGTGTAAQFEYPQGIAADGSGNLYVTDWGSRTIRKITPDGVVTTLAGKARELGNKDGRGAVARFVYPKGIAIAPDGKMYVADVYNYTIRKIEPGWPIGGTVNGLASGASVILQDTLTDTGAGTLAVNANGSFTFDMPAAASGVAGSAYNAYSASIATAQAGQTCTMTNGSGTATTDVTNITVDCSGSATPTYKLGGTVSGMAANTSVVLQNSNGENLTVAANGAFSFKGTVTAYAVTVVPTQPSGQPTGQTCTVTGGSGTATADVNNVAVSCTPNPYNINVSVSGLTGTLALQDNGGDNLSISTNGNNFKFATPVAYNGTYNVTVLTQPTGQTCTVSNAIGGTTGTVKGPVNMTVQCVTNTIGGTVSGLTGTVVLQDNGGDNLSVSAGTPNFTFATPVNYNGAYAVSVLTQPAGQTCSVTSGASGTATGSVSNVAVSCVDNAAAYSVGGTVMGFVTGTFSGPLVLQDNGGDNLTINPDATGSIPFTFATPVSGSYSVTILTQPTGGTAIPPCTVMVGGSGTASSSSGTGVTVTCQ